MDIVKLGTEVVAVASVAHTLLPPWEAFSDYPSFQKSYKLFVFIVGYFALNARSTLYQSISTQSGTKPSNAATGSAVDKALGVTTDDINKPANEPPQNGN